jgi:lysyl-tRNA synthetase class 2
VARDYPDARVGWLLADVRVEREHPYVEELKGRLARDLASLGVTDENLALHPDIARWRAVYSDMGVKPSKFRSSPEALARRVLKGKGMWSVSSVVDCYDCTSVSTLLSLGAHDAEKIDGVMTLRRCRAGEKFFPLGAGDEVIEADPRNIAYADDTKICCWLWNHRDSRLASVTEGTREAVFIVDSAFVPHATPIERGLDILWERIAKIGGTPKSRGIAGGG